MSRIDQVYCTHCTYGTSALQRREGPASMETAGWDARAGSLEGDKLRKLYDQLAVYKAYDLPADAARDLSDHLQLTAATAPRRLVFLPAAPGKLQTLGMVCHRQRDTSKEQRVRGVYFSHVLAGIAGEANGDRWTALDCLELWSAPWVGEDLPTLPHKLDPLQSIKAFLDGKPSSMNDDLLYRFLTTPPGEPFRDPQKIIPQRWRERPVEARVALLQVLLGGFLDRRLTASPQGLLIAAEPSFAAFLFYAIVRLLPDGPLRQIGFSTYEPDPRRINAAHLPLAATTFLHPENSGNWYSLREACQDRVFHYNTFLDLSPDVDSSANAYSRLIFDIQRHQIAIWADIDAFMADLQRAKIESFADLDSLAKFAREITQLGSSASPTLALPATRPSAWAAFLGQALLRTLEACSDKEAQIQKLASSKDSLVFLELLSGIGALGHANALIGRLSLELLPAILESPRIDQRTKAQAVYNYVKKREHFPANCPALWKPSQSGRPAISILDLVVESLKIPALERASVEPLSDFQSSECLSLFGSLVRASKKDTAKWELVFGGLNRQANDEYFYELLLRFAAEIPDSQDLLSHESCKPSLIREMTIFGERLKSLLEKLPENNRQNFELRLKILELCKDKNYFADFAGASRLLEVWRSILEWSGKTNISVDSLERLVKQIEKLPKLLHPDDPICDSTPRSMEIYGEVFDAHPELLPLPVRRRLCLKEFDVPIDPLLLMPVRPKAKKNKRLTHIIVTILIFLIGLSGIYVWSEYNRRNEEAAAQKIEAEKKEKEEKERKKKKQAEAEFLRFQAEQERKKKEAEAAKKAEEEQKVKLAAEATDSDAGSPTEKKNQPGEDAVANSSADGNANETAENSNTLPVKKMPHAVSEKWLELFQDSDLMKESPKKRMSQLLAAIESPPKKPLLVIHGLDFANQIIPFKSDLLDTQSTNPAKTSLSVNAGKSLFVKFSLMGKSLKYDIHTYPVHQLQALASCVLELKDEDNGEEPLYYALHEPLRFPAVKFEKGVANIDIKSLAKSNDADLYQSKINLDVVALVCKYPLFIGKGKIKLLESEKLRSFSFEENVEQKKTLKIDCFKPKYDLDRVEIEIAKCENGVFQIRLDQRLTEEEKMALEKKKEEIDTRLKTKKADEDKLKSIQEQYIILINPNVDIERWTNSYEKINKLAERNPSPLPQPPAKPKSDGRKSTELRDKYNAELLDYPNKLLEFKQAQIEEIKKSIDELKINLKNTKKENEVPWHDPREKFRNLCGSMESLSIILYRVVDGIRVDTIIIGDP